MKTKLKNTKVSQIAGLSLLFILAGCSRDAAVTGLTTSVTSSSVSGCTTSVVDYGLKANTAIAQRGLYSDTKVNPVTGYPVVAYTDAGSTPGGNLTIMISYWNGSKWVHEVAAGDNATSTAGAAQVVRLGITSTGIPLIFWTTNSTKVMMAGRSVGLSSSTSPTWTVGAIETLAAAVTTAMEVSVNPLDQVGVHYMHTATAATMRGRFVYCSTNCNNYANYNAMSSSTDFIDTATGGGGIQKAIGMAWCKASSTTYYPAVAYYGGNGGAAVLGMYAICRNATLANCGVSTGWNKLQLSAAPTTAADAAVSKLLIDPTITGDRPKVLNRTAAAATLSTYEVGQACTAAPTSTTTGVIAGTVATNADAWATILKDSANFYHIVFNTSTTSISYVNSNSAGVTGVFGTANFNAVQTMETVTTPAALSGGIGGADIYNSSSPTTNGALYASYGASAGTFNLTMGIVNGLSGGATSVFSTIYPSQVGGVQIQTTTAQVYRNVAIAATSAGRPGIAYVDYSGTTSTSGKLKYAYRNGTTSSDPWIVNLIPGAISPQYPSIAYDTNGTPWIGYYEANALGGSQRYYLVNNTRADGTGTWQTYQFPAVAASPKTASAAAGALTDDTAVAMYTTGGVTWPVLITASSGVNFALRASRLNPTTGKWYSATPTTIDAIASGIQKLSSDYDSNGNIAISYFDVASTNLKVATSTDGGITWNGPVVANATANVGQGHSIKINASGIPAVSYYNKAANNFFYSLCNLSSITACGGNAAGWSTVAQVNAAGSSVGVSALAAATDQWMSSAINFTSANVPYVLYPLGAGASSTPGLIQATSADGGATFSNATLYAGVNASTTLNAAANANNFALSGTQVSTVRVSDTKYSTAYIGPGNWLYVTSCGE